MSQIIIRNTEPTNVARGQGEPSFPSVTDNPKKIQLYIMARLGGGGGGGRAFPCLPDPMQLGKMLPIPIQAFTP